jgi:hypothetical protein
MIRKILGILNLVVGGFILAFFFLIIASGPFGYMVIDFKNPWTSISIFSLIFGVTSLICGKLVLGRKKQILNIVAGINLIFACFELFVLVVFSLLRLGG